MYGSGLGYPFPILGDPGVGVGIPYPQLGDPDVGVGVPYPMLGDPDVGVGVPFGVGIPIPLGRPNPSFGGIPMDDNYGPGGIPDWLLAAGKHKNKHGSCSR